ncbi:hypothetical protein IJU22_00280 [Candidatus Saccharibacteria bacterium]|nr:hypothetical protein [Candidatus Saccharibacteria bacterium]
MDDESEPKSLGAYENMEGPEIRPDFDADAEGEDTSKKNNIGQTASNIAKRALRDGENNAAKSVGNVAGKATGKAAAGKAAEVGLNAATGGIAGTALKVAEKTGVADKIKPGTILPGKISLKKAAPLLTILVVLIVLYIILSFTGQSLFAIAFVSRMKQTWNSTTWSNHEITDYQTNNSQLAEAETSEFGDVVFNEMGFTDDQIRSFEQAGLEYEEGEDGTKALVHYDVNGKKVYIVADKAVSGEAYVKDSIIANDNQTISDSGIDAEREAENIAKLTVALDVEEGGRIMKFSEALKDRAIRREYITATNSWRGDISGWFNEMAETVTSRLGISRNNWKDFTTTGDNDADEKAVIDMAKELPSATNGSDVGDLSYSDMVKDISEKSGGAGCGASSAFSTVESVANADQTARQVSAGSLWLESIDKTVAGEGTGAPLNASTNIVVRSGGADTEGMHYLFGSEQMNQGDEAIQLISAQANGGQTKGKGSIDLDQIPEEERPAYQTCIYEGDIHDHESKGPISAIGSMFKRIGSWIAGKAKDFISFIKKIFSGATEGFSEAIVAAMEPTVARFNQMKNQKYFTGEDTKLLGEAMVSSTERILAEKAKSGGQTAGDTGAVKTAYRIQQEVIAEQAEYDRDTKSQFDPTSEHTFLGKIAYSLIPFATSTSSISLTSTVSSLGNLISKSMASLLPTSNAISETELAISQGECVNSNSIAGFSNAHCNDYRTFDAEMTQKSGAKIFDEVARMRFDDGGYKYSISEAEGRIGIVEDARMPNEPDYGNEPLNPVESELPLHWSPRGDWGEGTPNGCESNWEYIMKGTGQYDENGKEIEKPYYYWDYPTEWSYSRITNFEYNGYKTGWPNRISKDEAGKEEAKNDDDPGGCMLDLSIGKEKQPVINKRGAYHLFNLMSGQRGSENGVGDATNAELVAKNDFTKGRIHPCLVGARACATYMSEYKWPADQDEVLSSIIMSRWIGGSSYVYKTDDDSMMQKGYENDEIFSDPTRGGKPFWEETKLYQAYTELLEWLENIGKIQKSSAYEKVAEYYEENPLDNSYEGILARFSGLKKDTVVAVLNLVNYSEFLANYDATNLYPLGAPAEETIEYDNTEIVAEAEKAIQSTGIVYDELRNRTVVA